MEHQENQDQENQEDSDQEDQDDDIAEQVMDNDDDLADFRQLVANSVGLRLEPDNSTQSTQSAELSISTSSVNSRELTFKELQQAILAILASKGAMSRSELAQELKLDETIPTVFFRMKNALENLRKDQKIKANGAAKRSLWMSICFHESTNWT